jgi:hypothetical protein
MDAKTRNLALLGGLSLFVGFALIWDNNLVLGAVFLTLAAVALGIAWEQWR